MTHEQMAAALVLHGWEPYVPKHNLAARQFLVKMPETDTTDTVLFVSWKTAFEARRGKNFLREFYTRAEWSHLTHEQITRTYMELVKRQHRGQS
jgi:hypothetical protein